MRQWAAVFGMPACVLNVPHVAPDILHELYPQILWWAADLVAIPKQKFRAGSPTHVTVQCVLAKRAPHVKASTLSHREEHLVG